MEDKDKLELSMSMADKAIADLVLKRYTAAKDATQTLRQVNWPSFFNMYRQVHETNTKHPYRSKIYVPLVFGQVRTMSTYLMQTIFSTDPAFKLKDVTGLKDEEKQALEKLMEIQCDNMDLYTSLKSFVLNMCIYGTGIGKVYWERNIEKIEVIKKIKKLKTANIGGLEVPVGFQTVEESSSEDSVNFDGPVFTNIDMNDFYWDPKADKLAGFWKIHMVSKTLKQLKAANAAKKEKLYKNLGQLEYQISTAEDDNSEENQLKKDRKVHSGIVESQSYDEAKIRLAEYWSADDKEVYVVAIDYGVTIRKSKNPFEHGKSPFVYGVFQEVPGQFPGMGIPEIVYGLQHNVNTITNQRNDNINLVLNRMWKVKRDAGVNIANLQSKPGNVIRVDEMDEIEELDTTDVTQSAYLEVQHNKSEAQEAIGTKYISGANPTGSNKTATGVRLNQGAEETIVQGVFKSLEATGLRPMVNMFCGLNKQFNDTDTAVQIMGPEGQMIDFTIPPSLFSTTYSFYAAGIRTVLQRDVQVHQMTNFLAIVGRIPPEQVLAYGIQIPEILKRIWEAMGLDDSNKIIGGQQQAQQVAQQAAEYGGMQAEAEAMGSGQMTDTSNPSNSLQSGNTGGGQQGTRIQ